MFTIYSDSGSDSTLVSNLFIDEYMKSANDAQIKVYLYLLRVMGAHRATSVADMADQFNHTEKDVVRSLRYWERKGLLNLTFDKQDDLVSICLCRPETPDGAGAVPRRNVLPFSPRGERPQTGTRYLPSLHAAPGEDFSLHMAAGGRATGEDLSLRMAAGENAPGEDFSLRMAAGGRATGEDLSLRMAAGENASGEDFSLRMAAGENAPGEDFSLRMAAGGRALQAVSSGTGGSDPAASVSCASPSPGPVFTAGSVSRSGQAGTTPAAAGTAAIPDPPDSGGRKNSPPAAEETSELEALENFRSNADRAQLLFVIEQYIGKPLSLNEIRIIYIISEKLRFSDDLLDHLIQYCVDRGKKDFRYIRKVAENWAARGIMTPAQAESAVVSDLPDSAGKRPSAGGSARAGSAAGAEEYSADRSRPEKNSRRARSANCFNQFEQNSYDFDTLEKELLQS